MSHGTPPAEHELLPGDVCDGYRIVSLIAAGGMGDVYEAVHDPSGRQVAVKCLKVRHRNKEDARARMKMEAVVLSELQHENLVQVYDAGVNEKGMVWFAMERLHGQTLREILFRAGNLPIPDALHYASEIADGADAVHEVNVIHRDLKPENVFVTEANVVKVLDLGTGKFTGYGLNSTDRMRVIGTTAYMSPEQIKGLRVDARADVYALGLILYEMIAGRHALTPEDGTALPDAIEQMAIMQLQMTPKPLADVAMACPRYVSAIVDRAIAKDRDQRFPNMAAMARELRAARKRFVAENQFDPRGAAVGEVLREKFGAPPRATPGPRAVANAGWGGAVDSRAAGAIHAPLVVIGGAPAALAPLSSPDTVADIPCAEAEDFPTELQEQGDITADGSTPAPGYVPTVLLSSSSVPAMPVAAGCTDLTDRGLAPDEVRNRTTQTNPIGFVRTAEPISEDSIDIDLGSASWLPFWRLPFFRRAVATLGLGAIIGVPPAILGVMWTRHYGGLPDASTLFSRAPSPALQGGQPATTPKSAPPAPATPVSSAAATLGTPPRAVEGRGIGGSGPAGAIAAAPSASAPLHVEVPFPEVTASPPRTARGRAKPSVLAPPPALTSESSPPRVEAQRAPPAAARSEPKTTPSSVAIDDPASTTILPPSGL